MHAESSPSQLEVVMKYGEPIETIDNYFLAKQTIYSIFTKKGYVPTFLPKINNECGNGSHVHISLWKDG